MNRTLIKEVEAGKKVLLKGWVFETRILSKLAFILLRDRTGFIQCVLKGDLIKEISNLSLESAIEIEGTAKKANVKAEFARKDVEIEIINLNILSKAEKLPIHINEKSTTTELMNRLDNRFLDTRKKRVHAVFRIRSSIYRNIVDFFAKEDFIIINTPKITTIGLESGAESFGVKYFNKKASLAQSPQFYKQMFVQGGFERVMEIGQVYRAEKSHTTRHLTEFTGVDFEMGFIKDENDIMDVAEKMFKFVIKNVKQECKVDLEILNIKLKIPKDIPRISMHELKKILSKKGKRLSEKDDLDSEAEKMIGEYVLDKYDEEFVFVTNYPWEVRPFYHMKPKNDSEGTRSFDILWRGVEIATGAQREHRIDILEKQAKEKGVELDPIYANIFKYGSIPHGGIGFGLDRITQRLLSLENIREALLLPRDPERLTP